MIIVEETHKKKHANQKLLMAGLIQLPHRLFLLLHQQLQLHIHALKILPVPMTHNVLIL
jgi:hypothetical protein